MKNAFTYEIQGNDFIFDKVGLKLFMEEFSTESFEIIIDSQGYLTRKNLYHPDWNPQYFHRWLKLKRTSRKDIEPSEVQVHHNNGKINDNRMRNLVFVGKFEHHNLHRVKKAYKTFCKKFYGDNPDGDPMLCNYLWRKFKEENNIY